MSQYIIYGLQDPVTLEIRYIGLSTKGILRPQEHLKRFRTKKVSQYPIYRWIKKLSLKYKHPKIIIIQEFLNKNDLPGAEIYWISYFKSIGSPLLNCTSGGDGVRNMIVTNEFKQKVSDSTKIWWDNLDTITQNKIIDNNLKHGLNKIKLIDQHGTEYVSMTDAAKKINCGVSAISLALKDDRPCKGFYFKRYA